MPDLATRKRLVAEQILENEHLRGDLDDAAAKVLLDWLLAIAESIVDATAGIEDDADADDVMYPRLKAQRRLAKQLDRWMQNAPQMDADAHYEALEKLLGYAAQMYGDGFAVPEAAQQAALLQRVADLAEQPDTLIHEVRTLIETQKMKGGHDGQAKDEKTDS